MAQGAGSKINNTGRTNLSSKNKNVNKNTDRMTIIIVAILLALLIGALVFAFSSDITFESISIYKTTITQPKVREDGTQKTVTATYNVEVDSNAVSKQEVEAVLAETMDGFTYEEFTGDNAMENLKESAMANLEAEFGQENIKDIYISDYNANLSAAQEQAQGATTESVEKRNGIMGGLFKKMD